MSAFNNSKFNLAKFNIESFGQVWLDGLSEASFAFDFSGLDLFFHGQSLVYIESNEPRIDKGMIASGNAVTEFSGDTDVIGLFNLSGSASENITAVTNLSQEVYTIGSSTEEFTSETNLSQEVQLTVSLTESFNITKMNLSQIVYVSSITGEVFQATADVVSLLEYVCEFPELTLKPGDVLIIDSGNYNVMYNGDNVIHLQSGEWFDNLTRATQNITISGTNASKLSASILYTERYL